MQGVKRHLELASAPPASKVRPPLAPMQVSAAVSAGRGKRARKQAATALVPDQQSQAPAQRSSARLQAKAGAPSQNSLLNSYVDPTHYFIESD